MKNSSGRRMGNAFQIYKFDSAKIDGKYIAICRICNKKLQNTASARLRGHRNICKPIEPDGTTEESSYKMEREDDTLRTLSIDLKTELIDDSNESMHYGNHNSSLPKHPNDHQSANEHNNIGNRIGEGQNMNYMVNIPLSPRNSRGRSFDSDIDDITLGEDDILIPKIRLGEGSFKKNTSVNSSSRQEKLQDEKTKAETLYFRKKAAFFQKQTENLEIQRKLMILQSQKLRLEIEKMRNEYE